MDITLPRSGSSDNGEQPTSNFSSNMTTDNSARVFHANPHANFNTYNIPTAPSFRAFQPWPIPPHNLQQPYSGHRVDTLQNHGRGNPAYYLPPSMHQNFSRPPEIAGFQPSNSANPPPETSAPQNFIHPQVDFARSRMPVPPYAIQPPTSNYTRRSSHDQHASGQNETRQPVTPPRVRSRSGQTSRGSVSHARSTSRPDASEFAGIMANSAEARAMLELAKREHHVVHGPKTKIVLTRATEELLETIPEHKRECPLCTLEFEDNNFLGIMSCCDTYAHVFCLSAWINSDNYKLKSICLKCRRQISARTKFNEVIPPVSTNKWDEDVTTSMDAPDDFTHDIEVDVTFRQRSYRSILPSYRSRMMRLVQERHEARLRGDLSMFTQEDLHDVSKSPTPQMSEFTRTTDMEDGRQNLETRAGAMAYAHRAEMRNTPDSSNRGGLDPSSRLQLRQSEAEHTVNYLKRKQDQRKQMVNASSFDQTAMQDHRIGADRNEIQVRDAIRQSQEAFRRHQAAAADLQRRNFMGFGGGNNLEELERQQSTSETGSNQLVPGVHAGLAQQVPGSRSAFMLPATAQYFPARIGQGRPDFQPFRPPPPPSQPGAAFDEMFQQDWNGFDS